MVASLGADPDILCQRLLVLWWLLVPVERAGHVAMASSVRHNQPHGAVKVGMKPEQTVSGEVRSRNSQRSSPRRRRQR